MSGIDQGTHGSDVAAYALGALEPAEAEAFREHLRDCASCREELAAFKHVVDALPLSATQHRAPRRLRLRVLDAVDREPKHELGSEPARPRRRFQLPSPIPRAALALGAAVAIVAVTIGGIEIGSSGSTGTRVFSAHVFGPGTAQMKITGNQGELIVHHLPAPPKGQIYEVWLGRPHRPLAPTSALFGVTTHGDADVAVPGNLHGVTAVMVTPEPAGGTQVPTHPVVISVQLS